VSEQCFTSPPTQYRLYGRRFLQAKRPNQHYQNTEGEPVDGVIVDLKAARKSIIIILLQYLSDMLTTAEHQWPDAMTCRNDHRHCTVDHSAMIPYDVLSI